MGTRWGRLTAGCVVAACTVVGCGAPDAAVPAASRVHPSTVPASRGPSTAAEVPTPPTTAPPPAPTPPPPPYSFDDSVPPPPLHNTGDDFAAIYASLDAYSHWLWAHNPDSSLIDNFAVPGTELHRTWERDLVYLSQHRRRLYDSASVITSVEVADTRPAFVSLRVRYTDDRRLIVDERGVVVDEPPLSPRSTWIVSLTFDGRVWRMADAGLAL